MSALRQPMIQLTVSLLVVLVLLRYVVPSMVGQLVKRGKELPLPTKILLDISNAFVNYGLLIGVVAVAVIGGIMYWRSTENGALIIDRIKLKLPLIGYFTKIGAVVQFSQTLGMLLQSGVNLSEALDIVVDIIDNRVLKKTLIEARDKIVKQGKIAQYLKQTDIFPSIAIYLINTGEQSGELDTMLLTVASNYEEELTELSDNLSASLAPILLIVMALIVGFIVMAIALPMADMADMSKMK
jgi:type II secretory pathway component PulF